jgi:ABC-type multidrug transport system ATPase subunit
LLDDRARDGRAILVSTHILDVVRNSGGRAVFLENGEKLHESRIASEKSLEDTYRDLIWGTSKSASRGAPPTLSPCPVPPTPRP